jgi:hypothetical protein
MPERSSQSIGATGLSERILRVAQRERIPLRCSAGVVAQVWRNGARQANLARVLRGIDIVALDASAAIRIGPALGATRTADVVDAHVALLASRGDQLLTSDPSDIRRLLGNRLRDVTIVSV